MSRAQAVSLPFDLRAFLASQAVKEVADDQRWLLALMCRQGPVVVGMLWRMLGSEADVLDAYQSAVCKLTELGQQGIRTNPAGYFYRTAMNAAIEILRSRKKAKEHCFGIAESRRAGQDFAGPESGLNQEEALGRLREAICQLPPQLRSVIILRDLAEMPYRHVAKVLGIQVGTARLYRRQAVVRLAELIGEEQV